MRPLSLSSVHVLIFGFGVLASIQSLQSADKKNVEWVHGTLIEMKRDTHVGSQGDKVHGTLDPGKSGNVDLTSSKQTITATVLIYVIEDEKISYLLERPQGLLRPHACDVKVGQAVDFVIRQDTLSLKEPDGKECKTWIRSQKMKSGQPATTDK